MPLRRLDRAVGFVHQVSGLESHPPVVYLPGVHGDWTPLERARSLLNRAHRLIEVAYPRVSHWTLSDFSHGLEHLLDQLGIHSAHLVGESFGSLVAWQFGLTHPGRVRSLVLVGGFSQPPRFGVAGIASAALKVTPTAALETGIDLYVARKTKRGERRSHDAGGPYPATRTDRGRLATANRMAIIQRADFRSHLGSVEFPVRYLGGTRDIVVPVRREVATLSRRLPAGCRFQSELVAGAPHPILASHPHPTTDQITRWILGIDVQ